MSCHLLVYGLPALGIYAVLSYSLRKKPHLLHKPRRFPVRCLHVSHRGGAGEQIENTLGAFKNAMSQGTNLLELDCHITKDGIVVVSHDENLKRQTGHNIDISHTYYEDLPRYLPSLEVQFSPGSFSHGTDHQIPRLEDIFEQFPGVPINIEIKEDNDELINKVARLVDQYNRSHISIWASFDSQILKKCHKANKDMPYTFSAKRGLLMLGLWYLGLLPFFPLKESFLEFVLPSIINRTYFPVKKGICGSLLAKVTTKLTMHKQLFKHLEDRGIQTLLWVLNEEKDYKEAFSYGASGVISDYPTHLRQYLNAHPLPPCNA
ncbi:PREDICTED: glycerophosphodiester phosphodiesterase domain-containing protein 3-like [Thamnophis sirtalis]|uniref:Glycerophosphodiester phosphodiesterase domain-containing protein 3-like n=1 Tax=Thamnophis sirtalis TaxID=35019 RepID=A0A6I9XYM4_9SAUR|nr:PREDICTED: glycerophosphodiester phosphodiesterase domain-containing protein 3-like [Thamnophis sirtalis]